MNDRHQDRIDQVDRDGSQTMEVFLSNRLEILYQQLKKSLFGISSHP